MKNLKVIIPASIGILIICLAAIKLSNNKQAIDKKANTVYSEVTEIPVIVALVKMQSTKKFIQKSGNFKARKELSIIAEMPGLIKKIHVTPGQKVVKGQIIASINAQSLESQLQTAHYALAKAQKDLERYTNLLEAGAISQTQYEEVKLGFENQQTNVTSLRQQLQYSVAKSPMSGIVQEIILEEGSFANPGTEIAKIVDVSRLHLILSLNEKEVVQVSTGQEIEILTEVYPEAMLKGTITQIGVQATSARKYELTIELINIKKHELKAGMYGSAKIPVDKSQDSQSLTIPRKSLVGSLKNPKVYIIKDGSAYLQDIEIGETIGNDIEVRSGLVRGQQVIVTGQINLDNGRKVKIQNSNL